MNNKKILVASNNTNFVNRIQSTLCQNDCLVKCTKAKNKKLIDSLENIQPDLIILDVPPTSKEGLRQMLGIRSVFDIPVLMLSSKAPIGDKVRTLSFDSPFNLSVKCITLHQLVLNIQNILDRNFCDGLLRGPVT
jgi:DNA-binding response OmpR family regulator